MKLKIKALLITIGILVSVISVAILVVSFLGSLIGLEATSLLLNSIILFVAWYMWVYYTLKNGLMPRLTNDTRE